MKLSQSQGSLHVIGLLAQLRQPAITKETYKGYELCKCTKQILALPDCHWHAEQSQNAQTPVPFNLGSKLLQVLLSQLFTLRCHLCELCCSNWRHCTNLGIPSCFMFSLFDLARRRHGNNINGRSIFPLSRVLAAGRNSCDWRNGEATKKTIRTHFVPNTTPSLSPSFGISGFFLWHGDCFYIQF